MIYCDDNNPHSNKTSLRDKGHTQKLKAVFSRTIKLIWVQIVCELWFICLAPESAVQIPHLLMTGLQLQCLTQSGIKGEPLWWSDVSKVNYLSKTRQTSVLQSRVILQCALLRRKKPSSYTCSCCC